MDPTLLAGLIGLGVVGMIVCVGMALAPAPSKAAEDRLNDLAGKRRRNVKVDPQKGILLRPETIDLGAAQGLAQFIPRLDGLADLYEQADVGIPFRQFLFVPLVLALVTAVLGLVLKQRVWIVAVSAGVMVVLPFFWLVMRKRKRIKQFTAQMPEALELMGRALRAGHGLASGMRVVAEEMGAPISVEFAHIYEEQNLGIPLEDALRGLAERVPTMDVRFFVTAVVIQRTTGGDLAEILDKIGRLIRERFQILGQVAALTGEGRLSGIVLLALPPALLGFIHMTNPAYADLLFTSTMGTKMLAVAAFMQVLGAIAIKKIITIKV